MKYRLPILRLSVVIASLSLPVASVAETKASQCVKGFLIHWLASEDLANEKPVSPSLLVEHVDPETGETERRSYVRTNSGIGNLFYVPKWLLTPEGLVGKSLLDIGTGGGRVVIGLRDMGADAHGVDILLNPQQKELPFFDSASADQLPYTDGRFDYVISANSIFDTSYASKNSDAFFLRCFRELARILKPGGTAYLQWADSPRVRALLGSVPELTLLADPDVPDALALRKK